MSLDEAEEFNAIGKWWVPGREQSPHPGEVRVSKDDGLFLNLFDDIGFLTRPQDGRYTSRSFDELFPIICGRTKLGPVTLIDTQRGKADFLILGALFNTVNDARFFRIKLQLQHFPEWFRQSVFEGSHTTWRTEQGDFIGNEWVYKYQSIPEEIFLANGLKFRLLFGMSLKGGFFTSITLKPIIYVEVSSNTAFTVTEWWLNVIRPWRDLISLAMDRPIEVSEFNVFDEREEMKPRVYKVFFKRRRTELVDQELTPNDMLFANTDIENGLGVLVDNWFRLAGC